MQHETKMENQSWLKKLARRLGPGHVVNLCFIVVLLFSTLLTWREVVVLEDAYISSQRNHLENVANALDKHLQYNVDKLIFLRNGMREALVAPLDFTSLRNAVTEFEQHRDEHAWQIELNRRRTLPVNGVSDALVSEETGDYDFEQLQSLADRRLYLAKQAGRNRVFASDNA